MSLKKVVFDLETQKEFAEVGGRGRNHLLKVSVAVAYAYPDNKFYVYEENAVHKLGELLQEADLVIGSRYVNGIRICNWSMGRLLLSYVASIYVRLITSMPLQDTTGGFKCFTRKALLSLDLGHIRSNGYSFQVELNYKVWSKGFRVKEIPITFYERRSGQSKMNKNIIWEALFIVFKLRLRNIFGVL